LEFDPSITDYSDGNIEYYNLWHYKNSTWINYGGIPCGRVIVSRRPRPFIVRLEQNKWGLQKGTHIILLYCNFPTGNNPPITFKVLRLKHIGARIPSTMTGYIPAVDFDTHWDELDSWITYDDWYRGFNVFGKGVYTPEWGIIYEHLSTSAQSEDQIGAATFTWKGPGDLRVYQGYTDANIQTIATDFIYPMEPFNKIFSGKYQWTIIGNEYGIDLFNCDTYWSEKRPMYFNPRIGSNETRWSFDGFQESCPYPWSVSEFMSGAIGVSYRIYISNFFIFVAPWAVNHNHVVPDPYYLSDHYMSVTDYEPANYHIFHAPNKWIDLNCQMSWHYQDEDPPSCIVSSDFDWKEDCSSMAKNQQTVFVKRKSDKAIWKYEARNKSTNIYQNPFTIQMKPVTPIIGEIYANYVCNGPPISSANDWNSLLIIER
jgi:hypothetical protein